MSVPRSDFSDDGLVSRSVEKGPAAFMPGHSGVLQMAAVLLSERAPENGASLVVGAGGGLDTPALALARLGWRFTGARNEALLRQAEFGDVETFYYAMNWQGWAAYA